MTNLIISRRCNQKCSYCFAPDLENAGTTAGSAAAIAPRDFISIADFEERLDFLDRSGIDQARFLGGEPTLHPRFPELIRRARARGKTIVVFSNGWMPNAALAALEELSPAECGVILNLTTTGADTPTPARQKRREAVMRRLGQRAQPGCTIYHAGQDLDFITALIEACGLKRAVRVGLAQPVLDGKNAFLPPKDYPIVGERLAAYALRAARSGIRVELDCGFVRCMFPDEALADLVELGVDFDWHCGPILDFDVDGRVFHCFPLSGQFWTGPLPGQSASAPLATAPAAGDLRDAFARQAAPYRQAGIYKECSSCPHKINQTCSGGCLANTIRRFQSQPFHIVATHSPS